MSSKSAPKPNMKSALSASLQAETSAFSSRFERAESALSKRAASVESSAENMAATPDVGSQTDTHEASTNTMPVLRAVAVVRDSFTMPENDYARIAQARQRCLAAGAHVTKAEVLRAGLLALSRLSDAELISVMGEVEKVKTGRPATKSQ